MSGLNKVTLIGHLGADPEVRFSGSGASIAKLSLATSEKWKDKRSGDMKEHTEWHRITFFGRSAEICDAYLQKGSHVYVEGKIRTSSYEKDGETKYSTEIHGSDMQMLGNIRTKADVEKKRAETGPKLTEEIDDEVPF
jgi:single-strand DNA-binding protein